MMPRPTPPPSGHPPADEPARDVGVRTAETLRLQGGVASPARDEVAVELPLEVRLNGEPFSVIMRTPGADVDLALGFLFSEGVLRGAPDVDRVDSDREAGVVNVLVRRGRADAVSQALSERRQVAMNSSCGLCGRRSLASLSLDAPALPVTWTVDAGTVSGLPLALHGAQPVFARTGGLHAAGLFDPEGRLEAGTEDVGRHNAVDKLVGRALADGRLPLGQSLLCVSGRSSFEIVQKAWLAGIPLVAAVSAPSSLAIDLAQQAGITLLGFVRDGRCNVYAHAGRVRPAAGA